MELSDYPEWETSIKELAQASGTVMLLGDSDTGKTTFCTLLVNAVLAGDRRVAVVDGDIGQSEIGPPACVGMGIPTEPIRSLSDVTPTALEFVGTTSPRGHLIEHVAAVRSMADAAQEHEPDLLIVDTTGFLRGTAAVRLKAAKFQLLKPNHVIAIQRGKECEATLAPIRYSANVAIHRFTPSTVITRKNAALRSQRRTGRFACYFEHAETRAYDFDTIAMTGTWLNNGTPLAPHILKFISNTLAVRAYYAEDNERFLSVMTEGIPADQQSLSLIQEHLHCHSITISPARRLKHLLVGLCDGEGRLLGVGLIETIDFRRRQIGVRTPVRAYAGVRLLKFGIMRVRADGVEVGTIRAGEV